MTTHELAAQQSAAKPAPRIKLFCVIRINDNRLMALAPADPENPEATLDWTDLGGETFLWIDRESAFQAGRANGGLLVSVDGLPGPFRMTAFHVAVKALRESEAAKVAAKPEGESRGKQIAENIEKARKVTRASAGVAEETEGGRPF